MQNIDMTERSGDVTPKNDDAQAGTSGLGIKRQDKKSRKDYRSRGACEQTSNAPPNGENKYDKRAVLIALFLTPVIEGALQLLSQFGQPTMLPGSHATDGLLLACRALSNGLTKAAARLTARLGDHHG